MIRIKSEYWMKNLQRPIMLESYHLGFPSVDAYLRGGHEFVGSRERFIELTFDDPVDELVFKLKYGV